MSWTETDSNGYRTRSRLAVPRASMLLNSSTGLPTSFPSASPPSVNTMGLLQEALQRSLEEPSPPRRLISPEGLQLLKTTIKVQDGVANVDEYCPITHMPFEIGSAITALPCGHRFGDEAIRRWLTKEKAECPICRAQLPHIENAAPTPRPAPAPVQDSVSRSQQLRRTIESATDELRSIGLEPNIAPSSFVNSRARVSIRSRMPRSSSSYIMSPEVAAPSWHPMSYRSPGPTSGSIQPLAQAGAAAALAVARSGGTLQEAAEASAAASGPASAPAPRDQELLDGMLALFVDRIYS